VRSKRYIDHDDIILDSHQWTMYDCVMSKILSDVVADILSEIMYDIIPESMTVLCQK